MMNGRDLTIGILMGGFSSEREISIKSGNAVYRVLKNVYKKVILIDFSSSEELKNKLKRIKVDCIFNALHGRFGEDGQVQQILDELEIKYTGSGASASGIAINKVASHQIFKNNGLRVPDQQVFNKGSFDIQGFAANFPLVVKPSLEGSSIGMSIVQNPEELFTALKKAVSFDQDVLIEKYISGREITVGILNDSPLPVIEVVPKNKFYDFQAKYTQGMTEYIVPADFPENLIKQVQADALKAHELLGCKCFSRVDMIIDGKDTPFILEVNTIPGLTATSLLPKAAKAAGIQFNELCQIMINSALDKEDQQEADLVLENKQ